MVNTFPSVVVLICVSLLQAAISANTNTTYIELYQYDLATQPTTAITLDDHDALQIDIHSFSNISIQHHHHTAHWTQYITVQHRPFYSIDLAVDVRNTSTSRRRRLRHWRRRQSRNIRMLRRAHSSGKPHRYYLSPVSMTWHEARSYCVQHYGAMASIMSRQDTRKARRYCPWHCWIGLQEQDSTPMLYTQWDNGRKIEYKNWHPGEPNNDFRHGGDCGEIYGGWWSRGYWNDIPCGYKRFALCEEGRGQLVGNYIAVQTPKTFDDADEYCQQHYGTRLATIHQFFDNVQVKKACKRIGVKDRDFSNACWIGLKGPFKKWSDGVYVNGPGKFNGWYHKQAGTDINRWKLICRLKNVAQGYFSASLRDSGVENPGDVEANTYCVIGELNPDEFKSAIDGKYRFKLEYGNMNGGSTVLVWQQTSWLTDGDVKGFEAEDVPGESSNSCSTFYGLGASHDRRSYLDGNGRRHCWFNSVGTMQSWRGGIPGFNQQVARSQALYVYVPPGMSTVCGNIHTNGKWYDSLCSERKHFVCNAAPYQDRLPPFMKKSLQMSAFQRHYDEWTNHHQIEHMQQVMKENLEKEDEMVDNPELKQQAEDDKTKHLEEFENVRQKLQKEGYFEKFKKQGWFDQSTLNTVFGNDMRLDYPVKWNSRRRVLLPDGQEEEAEETSNVVHVKKCAEISDSENYQVCVGDDGLVEILKFVNEDGRWRKTHSKANELMETTGMSHQYKIVMNEVTAGNGRYCLLQYLCVEIKDQHIRIEMRRIANVEPMELYFFHDHDWDEVVRHKNQGQFVEKCVALATWKLCMLTSGHELKQQTDSYRVSLFM